VADNEAFHEIQPLDCMKCIVSFKFVCKLVFPVYYFLTTTISVSCVLFLNCYCFVYADLYEITHNDVTYVNMCCFNIRLLYFLCKHS
jgi:hypothetical protein